MAPPPFDGTRVDAGALIRLRALALASLDRRLPRTAAAPGPVPTRRRGRGAEIDDLRPFVHGDDIRHIDRNATARTGVAHVRSFRDEREAALLLVADFRSAMLFGTRRAYRSVAAAEMLALSGWRALAAGGRVGLIAFGTGEPEMLRPASGERVLPRIAGVLERVHAAALAATGDGPSLDRMVDLAARALPRGGTLLLATGLDDPGDGLADALRRALHRAAVKVVLISDAFERAAPAGLYPVATKGGRRLHTVAGPAPEARTAELDDLARLGTHAVLVAAEQPPAAQLEILRRLHGHA